MKKRVLCFVLAAVTAVGMCFAFTGCGGGSSTADNGEGVEITVVQQYGMAYAPLKVMEKKGLIEENYDGDVTVNYQTLNSGASISDAFVSGDVQVGLMGLGPAITGSLNEGVPFKICSGIS